MSKRKMGDHYIPQFYLKGFTKSVDYELLISYSKKENNYILASPKIIALVNDLYSEDLEIYLSNVIEQPANKVINKIKDHMNIEYDDKLIFSKYMNVLWKRVPHHKNWVADRYPNIVGTIFDEIDNKLLEQENKYPEKRTLIEKRRKELKVIQETKKSQIINDVWHDNIPPKHTPRSVMALSHMTWKFYVTQFEKYFITSDNPLFFFESLGIGRPESEVSFPITKNIALWASWRSDIRQGYYPARSIIVDEINHRTISNSTKYIYSPRFDNWIRRVCNENNIQLKRIVSFAQHAAAGDLAKARRENAGNAFLFSC